MKKLMIAMCAGFAAVNIMAQEAAVTPSAKEVASQPTVKELLLEEDGVSIVTAQDGSFQIFARGSGEYLFIDPKVERNARRVAKLNAQKNFAEFIKNTVVASEGVEEMQKVSRTISGDGKVQEEQSSSEQLEDVKASITANTKAVISGLVMLESVKIPVEGTTKGTIQVTMVYSSKTAKAALSVGKKLQNHQAELQINEAKNVARVNAARQAVNNASNANASTPSSGVDASSSSAAASSPITVKPSGDYVPVNKAERRINKTEY